MHSQKGNYLDIFNFHLADSIMESTLGYALILPEALNLLTIDVGIDLFSPMDLTIQPGEQVILNTFVIIQFPKGKFGLSLDCRATYKSKEYNLHPPTPARDMTEKGPFQRPSQAMFSVPVARPVPNNIDLNCVNQQTFGKTAPWVDNSINWQIAKNVDLAHSNQISVYTDGSKLMDQVGCAFIVIKNNTIIKKNQFRLSDNSTVFSAEALAILEACRFLIRNGLENSRIFSDSMSVLQELAGQQTKNDLIREIKELIKSLPIKFFWVKAHRGTYWNEKVDMLAKDATRKKSIDFTTELGKMQIKNNLKRKGSRNGKNLGTIALKGKL